MLTFRQMTILLIHFLEMSLALVKKSKMDLRWFLWAVIALDSKTGWSVVHPRKSNEDERKRPELTKFAFG